MAGNCDMETTGSQLYGNKTLVEFNGNVPIPSDMSDGF